MSLPSSSQLQAASRALRDARATGQPISSVPKRFEFEGLEATYAVAEISTAARLEEPGRQMVGKKVGLKSEALRAAYWPARTMAQRGKSLRAGEVILSGALGSMLPLQPGDVVQARSAHWAPSAAGWNVRPADQGRNGSMRSSGAFMRGSW